MIIFLNTALLLSLLLKCWTLKIMKHFPNSDYTVYYSVYFYDFMSLLFNAILLTLYILMLWLKTPSWWMCSSVSMIFISIHSNNDFMSRDGDGDKDGDISISSKLSLSRRLCLCVFTVFSLYCSNERIFCPDQRPVAHRTRGVGTECGPPTHMGRGLSAAHQPTWVGQSDGLERDELLLLHLQLLVLAHQLQDGHVEVQQARQPRVLLVHDVVLGVHQLVLVRQRAEHDAEDEDLHPGALQQTHLVSQRQGGKTCRGAAEKYWVMAHRCTTEGNDRSSDEKTRQRGLSAGLGVDWWVRGHLSRPGCSSVFTETRETKVSSVKPGHLTGLYWGWGQ